ncbi:hypothetical protein Trydic_g3935 [Trypoxylus dichotomus]
MVELAGIKGVSRRSILLDKGGKTIPDTKGKFERWKEYIQDLFHDGRTEEQEDKRKKLSITVKTAMNEKAAGSGIVKLIVDGQIAVLVGLYSTVYAAKEKECKGMQGPLGDKPNE